MNHTTGYHLPLLQSVDTYFKVNYNLDHINSTLILNYFNSKILNISQFFSIRPRSFLLLSRKILLSPRLLGFKPSVNHNLPYKNYLTDARLPLRDLKNYQPFERILAHQETPKDTDIFLITSFRHGSRHTEAMEYRYQVIKKLSCLTSLINPEIGFSSEKLLPEKYAKVTYPRLSQDAYLGTLARAKVIIYTQGIAGCLSSKFGLAMASGAAVIGQPLGNNPGLLIKNSHLKEQLGNSNPDKIVGHAVHLATNPR